MDYKEFNTRSPVMAANQLIKGCTTKIDQLNYTKDLPTYISKNIIKEQSIIGTTSADTEVPSTESRPKDVNRKEGKITEEFLQGTKVLSPDICSIRNKFNKLAGSFEKSKSTTSSTTNTNNGNTDATESDKKNRKKIIVKSSKKAGKTNKSMEKVKMSNKNKKEKLNKKIAKKSATKKKEIKNNTVNRIIKRNQKDYIKNNIRDVRGSRGEDENARLTIAYGSIKEDDISTFYFSGQTATNTRKKGNSRRSFSVGNYLLPTFASSMKKNYKMRPANLLERLPFVVGSTNKSHNLAMKFQRAFHSGRKNNMLNQDVDNNSNYGCNICDGSNISRKLKRRNKLPTDTDSDLNNGSDVNFNQIQSVTNKQTAAQFDLAKMHSPLNIYDKEDERNKLIKRVLKKLYQNYSEKIARHEELEKKIVNKTDLNKESITEFQESCETMEDEENIIQAFIVLINNGVSLNKKVQKLQEQLRVHGKNQMLNIRKRITNNTRSKYNLKIPASFR